MFKMNENIPGWSSKEKMHMLAEYASKVPAEGWIVEIGCYVGRSTYALGMNKRDDVTLTCIDPWPKKQYGGRPYKDDILGTPITADEEYNFETWEMYTKDIVNIDPIRMWTPLTSPMIAPQQKVDLVFVDGGHTEEETFDNIMYWANILSDTGVIVVDDYMNDLHPWPGVDRAVNQATSVLGLNTKVVLDCMVFYK